jgi:endonuclease YncB( thermonuclease family)
MKRHLVRSLLGIAVFCFCSAAEAKAGSLFGKVIEVNDGDEITVFSLNRPARIKLIGIDAPEKDQPFGAVARQHLSDLVLGKDVTVDYSAITHDYSIVGVVLMGGIDVGAQMIRDGVAWYDPNTNRLTETQRAVYSQSEQAARGEKRGLWQAENPVAPWDYVKAQEQLRMRAKPKSAAGVEAGAPPRPPAELTNLSLLKTGEAPLPAKSNLSDTQVGWVSDAPVKQTWQPLHPAGANFTALVPGDGRQLTNSIPFGAQQVEVNHYIAREGSSVFSLMWLTGPFLGESDTLAIKSTLSGFLKGIGESFESSGRGQFNCEPQAEKDISTAGYTGREFDLRGCSVPGMARLYSKVINGERQMYAGAVFYAHDEPNVAKFLQSFTVKGSAKDKTKSTAKVSSSAVK